LGVAPMDGLTDLAGLAPRAVSVRLNIRNLRGTLVTVSETLRLALESLRVHKLRSFLTLLGVILAVTTLVSVMSVVAGLNFYVADRIANLGANTFVVDRFGIITSQDAWIKAQKRPYITEDEYLRLKESMTTASRVAGEENTGTDIRSGNDLLEDSNIVGVSPDYIEIRNMSVASGRAITESDDSHRSPVAFIGDDIRKKFFSNVDPIGKMIRAGTHSYQVIGVAAAIGTAFGQSQDNFVLIPLGTYLKEWHTQSGSLTLFIQARNTEIMNASQDEARMLLRAWRHVPYRSDDNFGLLGSDSIMALWKQLTGTLAGVAVGLTAVFLVVGGIVIMNIMLASVTERTREIGIRRSLGARKKHILLQFMSESALLAALGGTIGIALAYAVVALGRSATSIPMRTPIGAVVISLAVSTGIGLFFGIYPASRAANLDPIEALRADG
jgi:putative ABC transport system permease protein